MAVIYVYAFVDDRAATVADLAGIDGAPVRVEPGRAVGAVVSHHDHLEVRTEVTALQEHDRVVAALTDRCAVAPVRFGTTVPGIHELRRQLEERGGHLARVLCAVRGQVELAVRARHLQPVTPGAPGRPEEDGGDTPGRRYLAALRGPTTGVTGLDPVQAVHGELASLASAATARRDDDGTLLASYLVPSDRVGEFRSRVADRAAGHPDVALSLTGPWAPYSFVGGGW